MLYVSHLYCRIIVGQPANDMRRCITIVGNCDDIQCILPLNQTGSFQLATVRLIDMPPTTIRCITASFDYYDLRCMSLAPVQTFPDVRSAILYVDEHTDFYVCDLAIGFNPSSDRSCVVERCVPNNRLSVTVGRDTAQNDLIAQVLVDASTHFDILPVDVAGQGLSTIHCVSQGEAYTSRSCEVVTQTKVTQITCFVHRASVADDGSEILCTIPRMIGEPLEYVAIEVVLGSRYVDQRVCIISQALPESGDILCTIPGVIDGVSSWSRFTSSEYIYARLRNLGSSKVVQASIHYGDVTEAALEIKDIGSVYQIKFDRPETLPTSYLIIVTLDTANKVIVIDAPTGTFTI